MNEPEESADEVRDALHDAVDHIHASPDLAQRTESAARRRRTARWSVTGAIAFVAVGATVGLLTAGRSGAVPSATPTYSSETRLPACAAIASAYQHAGAVASSSPSSTKAEPAVPGSPVAAELCRYAGGGEQQPAGALAGSATITDKAQLAQLQAAMNASQLNPGGVMYCPASNGDAAVAIFAYPSGTADLTVYYDRGCGTLRTDTASYILRGDLGQLIIDWTGSWQPTASSSTN